MTVTAKAPCRISFCTGGDIEWYFNKMGWGNALNATINLYSHCSINGSKVKLWDDFPKESGLGGSASSLVALIKTFDKEWRISRPKIALALLAYAIEREWLGVLGGYQDQLASAYRGFNYYEFRPQEITVSPLRLSNSTINKLEERLILVHIPREKSGHDIHADMKKRSDKVIPIMKKKRKLCVQARDALKSGDIDLFAEIIRKDTELKRKQSPLIFTKSIDEILNIAQDNGCYSYRVLGAGSGGCLLFFCKSKQKLANALKSSVKIIPFKFERSKDVD